MSDVFEKVGFRGVIVSPASAIGGALAPVNDNSYGELAKDPVFGARVSIVFEYVAFEVQSVASGEATSGHIPPKTYKDTSLVESEGENEKPAERYFGLRESSLVESGNCDQVPSSPLVFVAYLHKPMSFVLSLQSPANTVMPSSSCIAMNGFEADSDKNGRVCES